MQSEHKVIKHDNPLCLLRGAYATSYTGYIRLLPRPDKLPTTGPPQLPAYQLDHLGNFVQTDGYRLHSFAASLDFQGNGLLTGVAISNIGGENPVDLVFTGDYTVNFSGGVYSGTFATVDAKGIRVEYYWIMSDHWRRLEFMVLRTLNNGAPYRPFVVAGTLTRIS